MVCWTQNETKCIFFRYREAKEKDNSTTTVPHTCTHDNPLLSFRRRNYQRKKTVDRKYEKFEANCEKKSNRPSWVANEDWNLIVHIVRRVCVEYPDDAAAFKCLCGSGCACLQVFVCISVTVPHSLIHRINCGVFTYEYCDNNNHIYRLAYERC